MIRPTPATTRLRTAAPAATASRKGMAVCSARLEAGPTATACTSRSGRRSRQRRARARSDPPATERSGAPPSRRLAGRHPAAPGATVTGRPPMRRLPYYLRCLQRHELGSDGLHRLHDLLVLHIGIRGALALHHERAARLQHAGLDLVYSFEALPAANALQLRHRAQLLRQCALVDLALVDEDARFSFQHLVESPVPEEEADDDIVREQERKRP